MNLKPELLQVMADLGVTEPELETLRSRMMSAVTGLTAQLNALNSQIETLSAQRDALKEELSKANITVDKLIDTSSASADQPVING